MIYLDSNQYSMQKSYIAFLPPFVKEIRAFLLLILFFSVSVVSGQDKEERFLDFNKGWEFKKSNSAVGLQEVSLDASNWRKVNLPHDWSIEDLPNQIPDSIVGPFSKAAIGTINTGFTIGGTGWYRNTFQLNSKQKDKLLYIDFDGVYMNSDVWINGHHLGNHPNGYTPFYYDLTPYLLPIGKVNTIVVQVKNEGVNSRWYSGSGIYRNVKLTFVNPVHINQWGVYVTTPKVTKESAQIDIVSTVINTTKATVSALIKIDLLDAKGNIAAKSSASVIIPGGEKRDSKQLVIIKKPKLWSGQTPDLYQAKVTILVDGNEQDQTTTAFGIREIKIDAKNGLLINGVSVKLKGGCIHNDNGPLGSVTIERAEERKIELLKANGFNAVRTSHNRPSKVFLDFCDKMGMLVISEAFDMWEKPKTQDDYHKYFKDHWNEDLTAMILSDRNHPSILLWSVGNEIKERVDSTGLEIRKMLVKRVHELDSSRLSTEALCRTPSWDIKTPEAFKELDVSGYNYQMERYENDHKKFPDRVIVASETYPNKALEYWGYVEKLPYVIGDFVWTAIDYMGEAGLGASAFFPTAGERVKVEWPWFNSNTGDLDLIGNKKPASYYRDVVWRESKIEMMARKPIPDGMFEFISWWGWPDVHHSWTWPEEEGKKLNVVVYTRCQLVKLELNSKVIAEQKVPENSITVTFDVPYQSGTLIARGYDNGKEVASRTLKTAGAPVAVKLKADRNIIKANRDDLSYVSVEIVDKEGNVVPNAEDIEIQFSISGNAEIAGVGNGNPIDVSSFQQPRKKVFHGKALAIIRSKEETGTIVLRANAKGLKEGSVKILIKQ